MSSLITPRKAKTFKPDVIGNRDSGRSELWTLCSTRPNHQETRYAITVTAEVERACKQLDSGWVLGGASTRSALSKMQQVVLGTRHRGLDLAYTLCKVYYRAKPSQTIK